MAKIISVLNPKGGCGKTTIAVHLARGLSLRGHRVLIADSDSQGSVRDWRQMQPDREDLPTVVGIDRPTLHTDIPPIAVAFDYIVVDGAARMEGKTGEIIGSAVKASDLVLLPVQPSALDIWGVKDLVDLVKTRWHVSDGRPQAAYVISRTKPNTILNREIASAVDPDIVVIDAWVGDREIYKKSIALGLTAYDIEISRLPSEVKAKRDSTAEIDRLVDRVLTIVHDPAKVTA